MFAGAALLASAVPASGGIMYSLSGGYLGPWAQTAPALRLASRETNTRTNFFILILSPLSNCRLTTTNALYSIQPACDCASASSFLPIGICKSKSHQRALVEAWFIGVNEKGMPCTKAFFFVQVHLCSCVSFVKVHVHV